MLADLREALGGSEPGRVVEGLLHGCSVAGDAAPRLLLANTLYAASGERSAERTNRRNAHRNRDWRTRAGTVGLRIPKLRRGRYVPGLLKPRRMAEKALTVVIREASIQGIWKRSVDDLVKAMGLEGISKSQAPRHDLRDLVDVSHSSVEPMQARLVTPPTGWPQAPI